MFFEGHSILRIGQSGHIVPLFRNPAPSGLLIMLTVAQVKLETSGVISFDCLRPELCATCISMVLATARVQSMLAGLGTLRLQLSRSSRLDYSVD